MFGVQFIEIYSCETSFRTNHDENFMKSEGDQIVVVVGSYNRVSYNRVSAMQFRIVVQHIRSGLDGVIFIIEPFQFHTYPDCSTECATIAKVPL